MVWKSKILKWLEKQNIKIVQLNSRLKRKLNNCINLNEDLNPSNLSYIIRNSKLHISENGLDLELASSFNKNIIYLDKNNKGKSTSPYWSKDSKYIYLNESENVNDINKIKPEKMVKPVLM